MEHPRVERIAAHAALTDGREELEEAAAWAAEGDADWQAWIDDVAAGLALVLRLDVVVEVRWPDGATDRFHAQAESICVEKHLDPPKVEEQRRELAGKDFPALVPRLRSAGLEIEESDLEAMYVHVELDHSLRQELRTLPALERIAELRPPEVGDPPR